MITNINKNIDVTNTDKNNDIFMINTDKNNDVTNKTKMI
jgi:hypothetical protein